MELKMSDAKLIFDTFESVEDMKPCKKRPIVVHAKSIPCAFRVNTLEGNYKQGKAGDYLIKGIDGELYICDKDIFEKTYDFVDIEIDIKSLDAAVNFIKNYNGGGNLYLTNAVSGWYVSERRFICQEVEWADLFGPFSKEELVYLELMGIKKW
jgi:hypothetical protein